MSAMYKIINTTEHNFRLRYMNKTIRLEPHGELLLDDTIPFHKMALKILPTTHKGLIEIIKEPTKPLNELNEQ